MKNKKILWGILLLLVCAGIGFGFYNLGKKNAEQSAEQKILDAEQKILDAEQKALDAEQKAHDAEQKALDEKEFNIMLNRSELENLQLVDGPIYVFGHKSPDSDTLCSSIVYAELLKQLGYDAKAAVLGDINNETDYILKTAGVETPETLEDAAGKNVVLIDHSEYSQSADGLNDAHIISIIDHHGDGSVVTGSQLVYDARPFGATATIIWMRARNYGLELDKSMATLLLGALLSDTSNLKSATSADRAAFEELVKIAEISDPQAFYQEIFKASISYSGMTDMEILVSDIKNYESGGRKYTIGCINAYDEAAASDLAERMKVLMQDLVTSRGVELGYAQISIYHDDISMNYIVPSDETAAEVLKAAFPDRTPEFDGTSYIFNPGMGRRQTLVPALSDVLAAHPGE
ncbi:MAG: DHH family phosphoesterase [Anaerolineaceae bacterium]|nr:DHH family phosphoesterase [Anaerolineaceae bacterium]